MPPWLASAEEVRLDIEPAHKPDIVASMTELGDIGEYDIVWCCHALEHLAPHDVETALSEFIRVLVPGGMALIQVPDLDGVRPTREVLFISPAGPITGHDLYYGLAAGVRVTPHMMHRSGFVRETMLSVLQDAGFSRCEAERLPHHNLLGVGVK